MTERVLDDGKIERTDECPVCGEIRVDVVDPESGEVVAVIKEGCEH